MRGVNTVPNVLIERHQSDALKGYPLPNQFATPRLFIIAHKIWLNGLRTENMAACAKLMQGIRTEKDSYVLAYLTGILHIRKDYAVFLRKGINACNDWLED